MIALILAAGFGTRLYPLTKETPKALIEINRKPIINYTLKKIEEINDIKTIYILTNNKFYINFLEWINDYKKIKKINIKLLNNGINNDYEKIGSIADLKNIINIIEEDDLLLLASDNIFGFNLNYLQDLSKINNSTTVALKIIENPDLIKKYSCVFLDENNKIISFEEKPQNPKGNICSTACYFIKKHDIIKIKNHNFKNLDNMGDIIAFLTKESIVHGKIYNDFWFDIGSIDELERIREFMKSIQR